MPQGKRIPKPADFKPEPMFPDGHAWAGTPRCQAWTPNQGRQCGKRAMRGLRVCATHGGHARKGAESPSFKHGGYSRYWPADLMARSQEFIEDAARITVLDELLLSRAMLVGDLEHLQELGGLPDWNKAHGLYQRASKALDRGDTKRAQGYLLQLGDMLRDGSDVTKAQERVLKGMEQVRRLVDTERQIKADAGEFMQRSLVVALLGELMLAVRDKVGPLPGGEDAVLYVSSRVRGYLGAINES